MKRYRMMLLPIAFVLMCTATLYGQEIKTIRNVDAASKTAYFNLTTGKEVADANADWDIAFNRTTILVNGGVAVRARARQCC